MPGNPGESQYNSITGIEFIRGATGALLGALHLQFRVGRHGGFEIDVRDCKGPRNAEMCDRGKRAVAAFCDWLKTTEAQRRISDLPRTRLAPSAVEFGERFEMESTIAALRQLRQRSLRFDVLRKKVSDMLGSSTGQAAASPLRDACACEKRAHPSTTAENCAQPFR